MTNQQNQSNQRKTVDLYRDAKTGQIVTQEYAERHPATTEHERYKKQNQN